MLKVRTLFSGIGSPESALKNLGIEFELVDFCEIDKYAVKSYCAIHGVDESKNLGDISKVWGRNLPYADMLVWGFPCTDISVAGKQKGIVEGETRSGLYYEGLRILKETKPKYSIIENVKNLTGKQFKEQFKQMLEDIDEIGYNNYWQVLNAKNYGIPQNRERVFIVSIRKDVDNGFEFPQGFDNGLRLKDMLEDEVDEKFYISNEKVERLISQLDMGKKLNVNPGGRGMNGNVHMGEFAPTLTTNKGEGPKIGIDKSYNNTKVIENANCITAREDRGISNHQAEGTAVCIPCITPDRVEKRQNGRRFKEDGDPSFTLTSQDRHGVLQVGNIVDTGNWGNPQRGRIYSKDGCSPALNTCGGGGLEPKIMVREATKLGYAIAEPGDSINIAFPNSDTRRGRVQKECAGTLETSCNQAVMVNKFGKMKNPHDIADEYFQENGFTEPIALDEQNKCIRKDFNVGTLTTDGSSPKKNNRVVVGDTCGYRIRKLTPKECFRLMGFNDEEFQRCVDAGVSNSQLYKQAGNSIVTDVLYHIFANLLPEEFMAEQEVI